MSLDEIEITVIGAGVVGLAVASAISALGYDVIVLERHRQFGQEVSSRNSEIIHAGIYYTEGSKKAFHCVNGSDLLYEFCQRHDVPHRPVGKFIIATTESEISVLETLLRKGERNGARELTLVDQKTLRRYEPNANGLAALYSPRSGIVDSHSFMAKLVQLAKKNGASFAFESPVTAFEVVSGGYVVVVGNGEYQFKTKAVINSAGLRSDQIASLVGIDIEKFGYQLRYCKGTYFRYSKPSPIARLIYPVPHQDLAGLGVHGTVDMAGSLRFGPDVEFVDTENYQVDDAKAQAFYESACKIIKNLDPFAFEPDMAGIRPKLRGSGIRDFIISHEVDKGLTGFINLIGIESPGLTASLSIAQEVSGWTKEILG